jgi:hypothetical protein
MDFKHFIKDIVTFNTYSWYTRWKKLEGILKRVTILPFKKKTNIKDIPIIINNRDRVGYLSKLVEWLEKNGYNNIYILDNDSTYPPLLEYYAKTKHHVIKLNANVGKHALWKSGVIKQFRSDYYVYTDCDVVPVEECPDNVLQYFMDLLDKYKYIEKVGFGLKIDDLPDHYADKEKVIEWEKKFWVNQVAKDIYKAEIDTTFALYRPYTNGFLWLQPAYRTGGKYMARHLPWYENSAAPKEEDIYYMSHIKGGISHWMPATNEGGK